MEEHAAWQARIETASVMLTRHFVAPCAKAGRPSPSHIAVRMEVRCAYAPCSAPLVVYRYAGMPVQDAFYCKRTHKRKAGMDRNDRRPRRGRVRREWEGR